MPKLEVKRVGNSTGLILPKERPGKRNLLQGDWLGVTENSDGSVRPSPDDPAFGKGMTVAEEAMKTDRNALAELAVRAPVRGSRGSRVSSFRPFTLSSFGSLASRHDCVTFPGITASISLPTRRRRSW
ncbi:hypothetical protein MKK88_25130 [Methylobacterium sp. E-005]|nr:hypothetical protein [Methylobacterium sp. E-005]MCJ2089246.1 hypothetical protein [Methylobacterium sp. E-005]